MQNKTTDTSPLSAALALRGVPAPKKPATMLVAIIRKDSKYAYQAQHQVEPFSVRVHPDSDGYILVGGYGGRYRMQDVHLFAETPQGLIELSSEANCHDD